MTLDLRPGDRVLLADDVTLEMQAKPGRVARLRITAPREVTIKHEKKHVEHVIESCQA